MIRRLAFVVAGVLACTCSAAAQTPAADGVDLLLRRLETLVQSGDDSVLAALVAPAFPADDLEEFKAYLFRPDTRRVVVAERDRAPLNGVLPGDGYRLMVELYVESLHRARIITVLFDVRRPSGGADDAWRIIGAQVVTSIDGLFRLRIDPSKQFAARNLSITSEDLVVTLTDGSVFPIESDDGVTGLVLLGRGMMQFSPGPETERGQLRIFSGAETLQTSFDAAFVRLNPVEYEQRVASSSLIPATVNRASCDARRSCSPAKARSPSASTCAILSSEPWSLLPPAGDFLVEVRTRRHGMLTYIRTATLAEDITLVHREDRHTIALYPSSQRRAANGGLSFNEDDRRDYDVLDYDIEANLSPETERLEGPRADAHPHSIAGSLHADSATGRRARGAEHREPRVRPPAVPSRPRSGQRDRQPSRSASRRRGADAARHLRRANRFAVRSTMKACRATAGGTTAS